MLCLRWRQQAPSALCVARAGARSAEAGMPTPAPLIDVRSLRKWFEIRRGAFGRPIGHVHAVEDVSFAINRHEMLGLAGESGSGKSTVGRMLLRLIEPTAGSVHFDGTDLLRLDRRSLRRFRQ